MLLAFRVLQDRGQGLPGQAPPLAAHMRHDAVGDPAFQLQPPLDPHPAVEQRALTFPREGKAQRKAFGIQPAHRPRHVRGGGAFDEIGLRAGGQIVDQLLDRPQRQAGARGEIDMVHLREFLQHQLGRRLRGGDNAPGAPFAAVAFAEPDQRIVRQRLDERAAGAPRHVAVDMDHHRTARCRPVPRDLRGTVQRGMHQHDGADGHAQFPLDISPRISSWRQLIYFSDHLHHRSGLSFSRSA